MTENSANLQIKVNGNFQGEIDSHAAITILTNIEEAFKASIKSINHLIGTESYPSLVFSSMKSGCTELSWKTKVQQKKKKRKLPLFDDDEIERLGVQAINRITDRVEKVKQNDVLEENYIPIKKPILKILKLVTNGVKSIKFNNISKNKIVSVNKEDYKKIIVKEAELSNQVFPKKIMKIIGTLVSIDVSISKEECLINSPFLGEIKCKYQKHLESAICHFIMPPRVDVIIEGEMTFKDNTGEIEFFTINEISDLNTHTKTIQNSDSTNWDKYVGILSNVRTDKTADEMTNWMIDTLWG